MNSIRMLSSLPDAPLGQVSVCRTAHPVRFRVQGRVTMKESPPLRKLGEQCLQCDPDGIRIDLCQCTYMDSTFLGTLLFLKRAADRRADGRFSVVTPSPECRQLFEQLGLTDVLPIELEAPPAEGEWLDLRADTGEDPAMFQRHVVEAHQQLADTPGKAGHAFRAVARGLTRELEART